MIKDGLLSEEGSGVSTHGFNPSDEPEPNVTPEEQEEYDRVVKNGMELLYTQEGKILPEVINRMATADPVKSLSQTAVWLVMMVENSAKQSGATISDEVLLHAGKELFEQLVEVAERAKIHDYSEKDLEGAWYNALDMWREANSGEGGRFDAEKAGMEFVELNNADAEGRADDILPGFSKLPDQMGAPVEAPPEEQML